MARRLTRTLLLVAACHTSTPSDDTDAVETDKSDTDVGTDTDFLHETDVSLDTDDTDPAGCDKSDPSPAGCVFSLAAATEGDPLVFTTSSCWTVTVDLHTITVKDGRPSATGKVEMWGDPHENLNGKHIKDWETRRRTLLIPGGIILTMDASGEQGVVETTTLYDGCHTRTIENATNTVTASVDNTTDAAAQEEAQADGETARITDLPGEALSYDNEYTQEEDEHGVPLTKEPNPARLGDTGGTANPTKVNDYYDDPRLGHT